MKEGGGGGGGGGGSRDANEEITYAAHTFCHNQYDRNDPK